MVLSYAYDRSFMVWCTDRSKISEGAGADVFRRDFNGYPTNAPCP